VSYCESHSQYLQAKYLSVTENNEHCSAYQYASLRTKPAKSLSVSATSYLTFLYMEVSIPQPTTILIPSRKSQSLKSNLLNVRTLHKAQPISYWERYCALFCIYVSFWMWEPVKFLSVTEERYSAFRDKPGIYLNSYKGTLISLFLFVRLIHTIYHRPCNNQVQRSDTEHSSTWKLYAKQPQRIICFQLQGNDTEHALTCTENNTRNKSPSTHQVPRIFTEQSATCKTHFHKPQPPTSCQLQNSDNEHSYTFKLHT
jgi:hypothetical protein